jgi:hypothetical protein
MDEARCRSELLCDMNTKTQERITEVATILAEGLQRALARQSSGKAPESGESSLHISPDQSGHPTSIREKAADGR